MRRTAWVWLLLAVALFAAGCDSGSSSSPATRLPKIGNGQGPVGGDTGSSGVAPPRGPVVIPDATHGGTITVLTPRLPSVRSGPVAAALVVRSLAQWRFDPASGRRYLVPDLSEDITRSNDTYRRWAFALEHHVRFADGARITARDVVRGIQHCLALGPAGPCRRLARHRPQVKALGRIEVKFRLATPFRHLPDLLATAATGPLLPGGRFEPTGPYRVASSRPDRLILVRNRQWDRVTDPGRTAYPRRYVFRTGLRHLAGHAIALRPLAGRDHGSAVRGFHRDHGGLPVWSMLWVAR